MTNNTEKCGLQTQSWTQILNQSHTNKNQNLNTATKAKPTRRFTKQRWQPTVRRLGKTKMAAPINRHLTDASAERDILPTLFPEEIIK